MCGVNLLPAVSDMTDHAELLRQAADKNLSGNNEVSVCQDIDNSHALEALLQFLLLCFPIPFF